MSLMISPFAGRRVRQALLGAVALGVLGGAIVTHDGFETSRALADTTQTQAGPASFADVVDRVKASVVSIKVKVSDGGDAESDDQDAGPRPHHGSPQFPPGSPFEHFFRQFGMPDEGDGGGHHPHVGMAQGSGFLISSDGYIVTNNHVVDHATEVNVTTADGKTIPAKVIGTDPKTDLALLKVKGDSFPFVSFAEKAPRVGDWVIAVGNPFGLGGTVTAGIVSARGRDIGSGPYDDFLQIDAPVNHGNSGGPTFNNQGQVVGVNTAIFSPSGGSVGIGFAISSDVVKSVVAQLKDSGMVARGWLGVEIQPVTPDLADSLGIKDASGALVAKESANSPATTAGVKVGDVITAVNGDKVADPHELARRIAALGPKKTAELAILRNGEAQTLDVTLGAMPVEKQQAKFEEPAAPERLGSVAKLGLTLKSNGNADGVAIADVNPDSVAAERGVQAGDVILDAGGKSVNKPEDVAQALDAAKADGKKALLLRVKSTDSVRFVALPVKAS